MATIRLDGAVGVSPNSLSEVEPEATAMGAPGSTASALARFSGNSMNRLLPPQSMSATRPSRRRATRLPPWVSFPFSARGCGSSLGPGGFCPVRTVLRVSHPLGGVSLPRPSSHVGRWRSWGSSCGPAACPEAAVCPRFPLRGSLPRLCSLDSTPALSPRLCSACVLGERGPTGLPEFFALCGWLLAP